jgi:hypothetical protein
MEADVECSAALLGLPLSDVCLLPDSEFGHLRICVSELVPRSQMDQYCNLNYHCDLRSIKFKG